MDALVVDTNATPLQYHHPFLIAQDKSNVLHIWSFASSPPTLYAVLEGTTTRPSCHIINQDRIVTVDQVDLVNSVILVHSLPAGTLLDRKPFDALQPRTYGDDGDTVPPPIEGECTPLFVHDGRCVVWRNGADARRGIVDVYELSEAGTLTLARQLHMSKDAPPLAVRNIGYEYLLPDPVHTTADYFIGTLVLHPSPTVHLIRWSSDGAQSIPSHAELSCAREEDPGMIMSATLQAHLFIPSSNQLILAHYEYPLDFNDERPVTSIRSIDPDKLKVEWHTSISQKVDNIYHHASSGLLIAIGWSHDPHGVCITVLDARTGEVRRTDTVGDRTLYNCGSIPTIPSGIHCSMTPSRDEIVAVFGDGQVAVSPLSEFVERGFVKVEERLVTKSFSDLEVSTPRNAKERRRAAAGNWAWVKRAFVGDGNVVVSPERGGGFVVLRWM